MPTRRASRRQRGGFLGWLFGSSNPTNSSNAAPSPEKRNQSTTNGAPAPEYTSAVSTGGRRSRKSKAKKSRKVRKARKGSRRH